MLFRRRRSGLCARHHRIHTHLAIPDQPAPLPQGVGRAYAPDTTESIPISQFPTASPSPACGRRWRAAPDEGASAASPHQRPASGTNARFAALAPLIRPPVTFSLTREKGWPPALRQSWPCLVHNANTSSRPRKNPVASCPASRDNAPSGIPPASHAFLVPHPRHDTSPSPPTLRRTATTPTPRTGKNPKPHCSTLHLCPEFPAMRVKGLKLTSLVTRPVPQQGSRA